MSIFECQKLLTKYDAYPFICSASNNIFQTVETHAASQRISSRLTVMPIRLMFMSTLWCDIFCDIQFHARIRQSLTGKLLSGSELQCRDISYNRLNLLAKMCGFGLQWITNSWFPLERLSALALLLPASFEFYPFFNLLFNFDMSEYALTYIWKEWKR